MNFTTFLSEEKITAADFENFITVAFNGGPEADKDTPIKSMAAYESNLPALEKIVTALKGAGFKGRMIQTGKAQGKLSPTWTGTDKTPKADMVVGRRGISLKKRGGSQLASAKQAETMSTFNAAVGFMDTDNPGQATKLASDLSDLMLEFAVPKKLGNIGEFLKKIKNPVEYRKTRGNERKLANEYLSKTDLFKVMTDRVRTFFDGNETFRNFFVYEAATGVEKFRPDPSAAANYIVAFDESGNTSIHQISKGYGKIGPYIPKLASTVKLRISWKTHSSKSQKTFPSFRADVRDDVNDEVTFQSMFEEHFSELNENIFTDAKNFLSNIKDKIQDFIKKAAAHIYSLAKKGIMAILRFLGILPERIAVSQALVEQVLHEAEYQGKKVKLDDPFRLPQGSKKKFGVYVKNPSSGNVVMVKFGDPNLSIKRDDPERLKNFRARHNCDQKTDKTTPGYWSCKFWEKNKPVSKLLSKGQVSEADLKFKGKEMKDHLDKAKAKLRAEYGSLENVDYKKAMKVVGATLAARLASRGMIKRSDGSTKKGKLGKPEEECAINEVNIPGYKGWVNPKTGKTQIIQGHRPYHVQMIVKNPRFYGLTEKLIMNHLIETYKELDSPIPEEDAEFAMQELKSGRRDIDHSVELLAMDRGWVRFVEGEYAEISGRKKFNDRELRKILQLIDEETPLTMKSKTTMGLQQYRPVGKTSVKVDYYGDLEMNEIKNLIKGRRKGDKQTEIGRTMAMFREAVKTRVPSDLEVLVVQDKDGNPNIFKDMESAQKKADSINGKVIRGNKDEIMVQVLVDPSLRKHLEEDEQWKDKNDEREHNKLFMKSLKVMPKSPQQKKIIQQMNALRKKNGLELLKEEERIPKTRKNQDPDTHSDLYTDEDPKGTIHGLGFKDVETAEASVRKIKASDRTHAHKIQAAIAMEQRAKVMKKTAEAAVYRKYIEQMKKKTKEMQEERKAPRDKGSGLPKKYVSGLSDKEAKQKAKEIEKRMKLPKDHPDAYKPVDDVEDPSIIDKKKSQQKSKATAKFQKAFGESFKEYIEEKKIKGIENKAKKTGVSYGILKQVYDRGMAAWRTGHRPGIPQQQWAYARINSFLTGGKTQKTTDKDLWAKVPAGVKSGIKAKLKEEAYLPGQATTSRGGKSGRGGSRGPRMSRQRKNRAEVLDQLALNGIQVLNQPQVVTGKGGSDTFVVVKKDVKKAKKVLDDYFEKPYVKIHMGKKGLRRDNYTIVAESVNEVYKDSGLGKWFGKGGGGGVEKGGWDRYNASGDRIGKCGDAPKGAAYSACLSAEKAKQLGKEGRAKFVQRKRDAQKKAGDKAKGGESKKGQKPVMVKTGAKGLDKKNESYMSFKSFISEGENKPNNPALWKKAIAKAKEKFDVYPSAYANAWASKWYKSKGGTWSKK